MSMSENNISDTCDSSSAKDDSYCSGTSHQEESLKLSGAVDNVCYMSADEAANSKQYKDFAQKVYEIVRDASCTRRSHARSSISGAVTKRSPGSFRNFQFPLSKNSFRSSQPNLGAVSDTFSYNGSEYGEWSSTPDVSSNSISADSDAVIPAPLSPYMNKLVRCKNDKFDLNMNLKVIGKLNDIILELRDKCNQVRQQDAIIEDLTDKLYCTEEDLKQTKHSALNVKMQADEAEKQMSEIHEEEYKIRGQKEKELLNDKKELNKLRDEVEQFKQTLCEYQQCKKELYDINHTYANEIETLNFKVQGFETELEEVKAEKLDLENKLRNAEVDQAFELSDKDKDIESLMASNSEMSDLLSKVNIKLDNELSNVSELNRLNGELNEEKKKLSVELQLVSQQKEELIVNHLSITRAQVKTHDELKELEKRFEQKNREFEEQNSNYEESSRELLAKDMIIKQLRDEIIKVTSEAFTQTDVTGKDISTEEETLKASIGKLIHTFNVKETSLSLMLDEKEDFVQSLLLKLNKISSDLLSMDLSADVKDKIEVLKTNLKTTESLHGSLNNKINCVENTLLELADKIGANEESLQALRKKKMSQEEEVKTLRQEMTSKSDEVEKLKENLALKKAAVEDLESDVQEKETIIREIQMSIGLEEKECEELRSIILSKDKEIIKYQDSVISKETEIVNLKGALDEKVKFILDLENALVAKKNEVTIINEASTNKTQLLTELKESLKSSNDKLGGLEDEKDAKEKIAADVLEKIRELEGEIESRKNSVSCLENEIGALTENVSLLDEEQCNLVMSVAETQSQISALEESLEQLSISNTKLESKMSGLQSSSTSKVELIEVTKKSIAEKETQLTDLKNIMKKKLSEETELAEIVRKKQEGLELLKESLTSMNGEVSSLSFQNETLAAEISFTTDKLSEQTETVSNLAETASHLEEKEKSFLLTQVVSLLKELENQKSKEMSLSEQLESSLKEGTAFREALELKVEAAQALENLLQEKESEMELLQGKISKEVKRILEVKKNLGNFEENSKILTNKLKFNTKNLAKKEKELMEVNKDADNLRLKCKSLLRDEEQLTMKLTEAENTCKDLLLKLHEKELELEKESTEKRIVQNSLASTQAELTTLKNSRNQPHASKTLLEPESQAKKRMMGSEQSSIYSDGSSDSEIIPSTVKRQVVRAPLTDLSNNSLRLLAGSSRQVGVKRASPVGHSGSDKKMRLSDENEDHTRLRVKSVACGSSSSVPSSTRGSSTCVVSAPSCPPNRQTEVVNSSAPTRGVSERQVRAGARPLTNRKKDDCRQQ